MICCIKAVTLMEGTNVIWCGVDPEVQETDRSTQGTGRHAREPVDIFLFVYAHQYNNP